MFYHIFLIIPDTDSGFSIATFERSYAHIETHKPRSEAYQEGIRRLEMLTSVATTGFGESPSRRGELPHLWPHHVWI